MDTTAPPVTESPTLEWFEPYFKYPYLKFLGLVAAVAYAFGFFTVMVHTAHYGLPVIQLIEPLHLWVGLIPSVVLFATWQGVKVVAKSIPSDRVEPFVHKIGVGRAKNAVIGLHAFSAVLMVFFAFRYSSRIRGNPWFGLSVLLVLLVTAFVLAVAHSAVCKADPSRYWGFMPRFLRVWLIIVTLIVALAIFKVYVAGIYPSLPQRYGFGDPALVRLVVDPNKMPSELLDSQMSPQGPPKITKRIRLLYRTAREHILLCDECKAKTLSLSNDGVYGIIWQESSEPARDRSK